MGQFGYTLSYTYPESGTAGGIAGSFKFAYFSELARTFTSSIGLLYRTGHIQMVFKNTRLVPGVMMESAHISFRHCYVLIVLCHIGETLGDRMLSPWLLDFQFSRAESLPPRAFWSLPTPSRAPSASRSCRWPADRPP